MPKGYVAGPMRGYPQYNFPAFDAAADIGRRLGHTIISPADMDRSAGIDEKETLVIGYGEIRTFVKRDTEALLTLRAEDGDFIALLPNWFKSTGATAEVFLGRWLKLAFLDAETFEPWRLLPDGIPMPTNRPVESACSLGDGMCGESRDLATRSTIAIATEWSNRKEL